MINEPLQPQCIKCGSKDANLIYCDGTYYKHYGIRLLSISAEINLPHLNGEKELLHCRCRACGYKWNALPLVAQIKESV